VHLRTCATNRRGVANLTSSFYPPLPVDHIARVLVGAAGGAGGVLGGVLRGGGAVGWSAAWVVGPDTCTRGAEVRALQVALAGRPVRVHSLPLHLNDGATPLSGAVTQQVATAGGRAFLGPSGVRSSPKRIFSQSISPSDTSVVVRGGGGGTASEMGRASSRRRLALDRKNTNTNNRNKNDYTSDNDRDRSKKAVVAAALAWGPAAALVGDFLFLVATTGPLLLSVGSLSFWAGFLSRSQTVHVPLAGRQQQYVMPPPSRGASAARSNVAATAALRGTLREGTRNGKGGLGEIAGKYIYHDLRHIDAN